MSTYYNEFDPKAAAWLRQLIKNGLIADGTVDERSITDVTAADLRGFTQHHFFAGIGGWSYALRLADWPDDRPVCTASLPCQPFSVAGSQKGTADERHLLPHFIELVRGAGFTTIFGEQVPGAIKHGWLDDLCDEMERENYTTRAAVLTAAGAGALHIRQRLYWVANSNSIRRHSRKESTEQKARQYAGDDMRSATNERMADSNNTRLERRQRSGCADKQLVGTDSVVDGMVYANGDGPQQGREFTEATRYGNTIEPAGGSSGMVNTKHNGQPASSESIGDATSIRYGQTGKNSTGEPARTSASALISEWENPEWLYCRDNKHRPIKPGIKPLVDGISRGMGYSSDTSESIDANNTQEARVMRLKGYGNAIVPQVAAQFIKDFMVSL